MNKLKNLRLIVPIVCIMCFGLQSVKAQGLYYGIRGGGSISDLTDRPNSKVVFGGNVGGFFGYQFTTVWGLQLEAIYSFQGYRAGVFAADGIKDGDKVSLQYIKVPMVVKMFLIGGLNFEMGASFNFLTTARVNKQKHKGCNWFDLSIPLGLAYQFNRKIELGARYDISTIAVDKNITGSNGVLSLNLAWKF